MVLKFKNSHIVCFIENINCFTDIIIVRVNLNLDDIATFEELYSKVNHTSCFGAEKESP